MASRRIDDLERSFRPQVRALISAANEAGLEPTVYQTLRSPYEQARLWRMTRGTPIIADQIRDLRDKGASFIAHCLEVVGPQFPGPNIKGHVTHAVPGRSWHQHGEAVDFYVKGGTGDIAWESSDNGWDQYEEVARLARDAGLESGWFWPGKKKDPGHVQARKGSTLNVFGGWVGLDANLKRLFENVDPET